MQTLVSALDAIIPASEDGRLPGAGELGLAEPIAAQPALHPLLQAGLDALEAWARGRGAACFSDLAADERRAALDGVSLESPALLPSLVAQTIVAYYQNLRVWQAIGLEPRAPHPKGYAVPATDFSILDPVRARAPFYREP
jgi:hypothetical protein